MKVVNLSPVLYTPKSSKKITVFHPRAHKLWEIVHNIYNYSAKYLVPVSLSLTHKYNPLKTCGYWLYQVHIPPFYAFLTKMHKITSRLELYMSLLLSNKNYTKQKNKKLYTH